MQQLSCVNGIVHYLHWPVTQVWVINVQSMKSVLISSIETIDYHQS